jgi:hypothetical protein
MEPKNRFQGIDSENLFSMEGRYDNSTPTRFLAPIDCSKFQHRSLISCRSARLNSLHVDPLVFLLVSVANHPFFCQAWAAWQSKCRGGGGGQEENRQTVWKRHVWVQCSSDSSAAASWTGGPDSIPVLAPLWRSLFWAAAVKISVWVSTIPIYSMLLKCISQLKKNSRINKE